MRQSAKRSGVAELPTQLGYATSAAETSDRLALIRTRTGGCVFVAERDGAVCGWILVMPTYSLTSQARTEIAGIVVDAATRGQGMGGALVNAGTGWTREQGHPELRVRSNTVHEDAHRFFEREGFVRIKPQVLFGKSI